VRTLADVDHDSASAQLTSIFAQGYTAFLSISHGLEEHSSILNNLGTTVDESFTITPLAHERVSPSISFAAYFEAAPIGHIGEIKSEVLVVKVLQKIAVHLVDQVLDVGSTRMPIGYSGRQLSSKGVTHDVKCGVGVQDGSRFVQYGPAGPQQLGRPR
jgi:hypothetical protein